MPVTVSVAIPVYNGERYIAEAIDSVLFQTVLPAEFKVYDNASTDATVDIALRHMPAEDVRTSIHNVGAADNFERALGNARADTEYFMWLAADDRLRPTFLERCIDRLAADPEAPACLTGIRFIDPDGHVLRVQRDPDLASTHLSIRLRSFLRRPRWTEFYCLYRMEALQRSPGVTRLFASDVHLTWWFLLRGPLAVIDEPLIDYREYAVKSSTEMAESLNPGGSAPRWVKVNLWRHLWRMTREPGVLSPTRARVELLTALAHFRWWVHLAEDVLARWPRLEPLVRRSVRALRRFRASAER